MFKGLHQKYAKKKMPPPNSQIAVGKPTAVLMPLSAIHAF